MQIVLMRHGKAANQSLQVADHDRELTPKGIKKVKAVAQSLGGSLLCGERIRIWSSPLLRARQTAQILASTIPCEAIGEYQEISTGDLDGLIRHWSELPPQITLIIVGHEPYLSNWGARIAGVTLSFRRASAACFTLDDPRTGQGSLAWFAHAKILAKLAAKGGKQGG